MDCAFIKLIALQANQTVMWKIIVKCGKHSNIRFPIIRSIVNMVLTIYILCPSDNYKVTAGSGAAGFTKYARRSMFISGRSIYLLKIVYDVYINT